MSALALALCTLPAQAQTPTTTASEVAAPGSALTLPPDQRQTKTTLRLKTPDNPVRLFAADCEIFCSLSALFAPVVERDRVAPLPVTNLSTQAVIVSSRFVPTNALAMASAPLLALDPMPVTSPPKSLLADPNATISVASGDTAQFKVALRSMRLSAGLYTGQIEFRAKPATGDAEPITQFTTVEVRIRDSAIWALLTVVLGIVLGRVAQLVYDPQIMAKVQLLDWMHQLEAKIAQVRDNATRDALTARLGALRTQLFSRGADVTAMQTAFRTLETDVGAAIGGPAIAAIAPPVRAPQHGGFGANIGAGIGHVFRILAGVTPLSLESVYDWLLPVFVLLTLIALTVVFMLQQYGGSGAAETFGAGGLADYASLFLAGVASEAIAGGLRTVKLR